MADAPKKKPNSAKGGHNDTRPNGKAWKKGKAPRDREARALTPEEQARSEEKQLRKESHRRRRENDYVMAVERERRQAIEAKKAALKAAKAGDNLEKLKLTLPH